MTWTYSSTSSALSLKDRVRFLVRDTDTTRQLVQDEEINWALADVGSNYYAAAATVCRTIAASQRDANSVTVGDVKEEGGDSSDWLDLAADYERRAVTLVSCPAPFLGGSSIDRKRDNAGDTDRTRPSFVIAQFDNPAASTWAST